MSYPIELTKTWTPRLFANFARAVVAGFASTGWVILTTAVVLCATSGTDNLALAQALAQAQVPGQPDLTKLPNRELHVPIKDLQVLLTGPNQRVIMTRAEYEKLLQDAKLTPEAIETARQNEQALANLPTPVEMLHATHSIRVELGRAIIDSEYDLELLRDSWIELPLDFSNVELISATFDNQTAWLRKLPTDAAPAVLICKGKGEHKLKFRILAAVTESSAQQSFNFVLPSSASSNWKMQFQETWRYWLEQMYPIAP